MLVSYLAEYMARAGLTGSAPSTVGDGASRHGLAV